MLCFRHLGSRRINIKTEGSLISLLFVNAAGCISNEY